MSDNGNVPEGLLATRQVDLFFEDDEIGRMKKEIWEADEAAVDAILAYSYELCQSLPPFRE